MFVETVTRTGRIPTDFAIPGPTATGELGHGAQTRFHGPTLNLSLVHPAARPLDAR